MDRVTSDDMRLAAEWLDCNEGAEGEAGTCKRVAKWLRTQALRREFAAIDRAVAKKTGAPLSRVRAVLRGKRQ